VAAPINLSFEDQGTNPGEADGWSTVYVSTARGLASFPIGPGQWQAVEDFEQGWQNDDYSFAFELGDTAAAVFDAPLPAQVFEDFEEGWGGTYFFTGPPTADATIGFNDDVETFEEGWNATSANFTVGVLFNRLVSASHGLTDGRVVQLRSTGTLPTPLDPLTRYYVVNSTPNYYQVSLTEGGPEVQIITGGTGVYTWYSGHVPTFETELSSTAEAVFDGGPATAETFEAADGWDAGYQTTLGSTAAASFGASADPVEDFEDVKELQTFTITGASNLFAAGHGYNDGDRVTLESTGTFPDGLSGAPLYYVVNAATDTFQVELTSGGGAVTINDGGAGIHTVRADRAVYWTELESF